MPDLFLETVELPLATPFITAARRIDTYRAIRVRLQNQQAIGYGEARGIPLHGETPESMIHQLESLRGIIEGGATRQDIQALLPPGGARNALDCAFWHLEAAAQGISLWDLTAIAKGTATTAITLSIGPPEEMARQAASLTRFPLLKLKIDGADQIAQVAAVRRARPQATLIVDANQSIDGTTLSQFMEDLAALKVALLEQPLAKGDDQLLAEIDHPLPLCADESVLTRQDIDLAAKRYAMINIKLDKAGGLTEALAMVKKARKLGLKIMTGNMLGSSLALAPALLIARLSDYADLDGPLLLAKDDTSYLSFDGARVSANF